MPANMETPFDVWMQPGLSLFEEWVSYFPTAPLFGVPWKFAPTMQQPWTAVSPDIREKSRTSARMSPNKKDERAEPSVVADTAAAGANSVDTVTLVSNASVYSAAHTKDLSFESPASDQPIPAQAAPASTASAAAVVAADKSDDAKSDKMTDVPPAPTEPAKPKGLLKHPPADMDDLKLIKGIGPALAQELNGLGVYRFRQIAKMKEADLDWVDANLSSFKGRCFRDDWVGQAKSLMG